MTETLEAISALKTQAQTDIEQVSDVAGLEAWRVKYLGRKGQVRAVVEQLSSLTAEEKKTAGQAANDLRQTLHALYQEKLANYEGGESAAKTAYDPATSIGHVHPLTITIRRVQDIFRAMGFLVVAGPEVEEQKYNFDLLNISAEHPARAETDTFFIAHQKGSDNLPLILRTQTSPVQIRATHEFNLQPPFRILSPGRVFRSERTDATHEHTFYQFEGLAISEDTTIGNFKGVIESFYSTFLQKDVKARLRPSYFPFVEPGFEVDISCVFCGANAKSREASAKWDGQQGCRVCKYSGWIEVMGAGMVHPNVLKNMNVDPDKYQGYAFGGAIDRLTMLRHGINDIRLFWSGDIRFLKQFS